MWAAIVAVLTFLARLLEFLRDRREQQEARAVLEQEQRRANEEARKKADEIQATVDAADGLADLRRRMQQYRRTDE